MIDKDPAAFRRLGPPISPGSQVVGQGFDRDVLVEAGRRARPAFAAVSCGDNSNIIAARVARETFGIDRVVARIYDAKRAAGLRAARHPDRGHRAVDHRPADAHAAARRRGLSDGASPPAPSRSCRCRSTRSGSAARARAGGRPPACRVAFIVRFGTGVLPRAETVRAGRRHDLRRGGVGHRQRRHVRSGRAAAGGGLSRADRDRGSRGRRALHRRGAGRQRPPGDADRAGAVEHRARAGRGGRVGARRRLRARLAGGSRPGDAATS